MTTFHCDVCGKNLPVPTDGCTTGYGTFKAPDGAKSMSRENALVAHAPHALYLSNWPGSLLIRVAHAKEGSHNWTLRRTDVWFRDAHGFQWHGVHVGKYSDLVRCKRTKAPRVMPAWARTHVPTGDAA
jgi:hypothetical protein